MNFTDILVVFGLFALRIGVPVAITAALVYFLKQLDRRWETEARAQSEARRATESAAVQQVRQPAVQPARAAQVDLAAQRVSPSSVPAQPGLVYGAPMQPCWEIKGCPESSYASCAAYLQPGQPCWQARLQAEGKIPDRCPTCEIFQRYPM